MKILLLILIFSSIAGSIAIVFAILKVGKQAREDIKKIIDQDSFSIPSSVFSEMKISNQKSNGVQVIVDVREYFDDSQSLAYPKKN